MEGLFLTESNNYSITLNKQIKLQNILLTSDDQNNLEVKLLESTTFNLETTIKELNNISIKHIAVVQMDNNHLFFSKKHLRPNHNHLFFS